jgi:hypothetical protein
MRDSARSSSEIVLQTFSFPGKEKSVAFIKNIPQELAEFISANIDLSAEYTKIVDVQSRFEIEKIKESDTLNIVNLKRINDIRHLNKFFETVNTILPHNGVYIGCVETIELRKERIYRKYTPFVARHFYLLDFIYKRVLPKWKPTRKIYFVFSKGRNRVLSRTETFGRLFSCGFKILSYKEINGHLYFAVKNIGSPAFDSNPTYGLIVKLKRIGQNGKPINVYKIRTMHPYAEYVQGYVFNQNNVKDGGKFSKDFRITKWGRFLRKLWIDELPMIYNFIKGDLKLVGVRPLSPHYLSLYTEEHRQKRFKFKPGLVPPYYADMPKTLPEIMESESRYLDRYSKNPVRTDMIYLWLIFKNIVLKRQRSS